MTEPKSLWEDLKQRRVFRAVLLYAVFGWGAFQVTESVAPVLDFPDWVTLLVLYLLLLGFPIVAGLAWAFDVTSKGVKSAEPGGRRVIYPVVGASMLAVVIGAYTLGKSSGDPQTAETTDPSRFAVAPFRASVGPDLSYLGEGMVDLLSIRLAEESGVSAVDPASMFAALKGTEEPRARADLTAAATRLGAGRLLSGGIVGDRRRLVITAELVDVEGGSSPIPVRVEGSLDSISVLVDQLIGQLLSIEAGEREDRVRYLADSPPEAIRAYLEGRSHYRAGHYPEAVGAFQEAIRGDSTFALAGVALAAAAEMMIPPPVGVGARGNEIAWRHRNRLPAADRDFLTLKLGARYPEVRTDRQRITDAERAVALFPDRAEAWLNLGEWLFHDGPSLGIPEALSRAAAAFERTLDIDEGLVVAIQHLFWVALINSDSTTARRLGDLQLELDPTPTIQWLVAASRVRTQALTQLEETIDTQDSEALLMVAFIAAVNVFYVPPVDLHATADRAVDILGTRNTPASYLLTFFNLALERGRPASAVRHLEAWRQRTGNDAQADRHLMLAAAFGDGPMPEAEAAERSTTERLRAAATGAGPLALETVRDVCSVEIWKLHSGRTDSATRSSALLRESQFDRQAVRDEATGCALMIDAWLSVASGGANAESMVDELEDWTLQGYPLHPAVEYGLGLFLGSLRGSLGDLEGAMRALRRGGRRDPNMRYVASTKRALADFAEQVGDRELAIEALDYYVHVRRTGEPSMRSELESAQRRLDRLVLQGDR